MIFRFFFLFDVTFDFIFVFVDIFDLLFGFGEQGGEFGDAVDELGQRGHALVERGVVDGFGDAVGENLGNGQELVVEVLEGFGGVGGEFGSPHPRHLSLRARGVGS